MATVQSCRRQIRRVGSGILVTTLKDLGTPSAPRDTRLNRMVDRAERQLREKREQEAAYLPQWEDDHRKLLAKRQQLEEVNKRRLERQQQIKLLIASPEATASQILALTQQLERSEAASSAADKRLAELTIRIRKAERRVSKGKAAQAAIGEQQIDQGKID